MAKASLPAGDWIADVVTRLRERATEHRRKGCVTAAVDLEIEAQRMESLPR